MRYPGSLQMCLAFGVLAVLDPDFMPRCPLLAPSSPCRAVSTCLTLVHHHDTPLPCCPSVTLATSQLPSASLPCIPHLPHYPSQVRINRTAQLRFVLASTLAGMADSDTSPPRAQDGNDPDATGTPGQEHAAATQATSHAVSLASLVAPAAVERSTDAGLSPAAEAALDVDAARKVRVVERPCHLMLVRCSKDVMSTYDSRVAQALLCLVSCCARAVGHAPGWCRHVHTACCSSHPHGYACVQACT